MRLSLEIAGRRFSVALAAERDHPQQWEPQPDGSTCGVLERPTSWDHDTRQPIGFAGHLNRPKES